MLGRIPQQTLKHHPEQLFSYKRTIEEQELRVLKDKCTCLKRDIPRRIARTASLVLLLPPVKASQMPVTDGRKSLRERNEGLEEKMGGLKEDCNGNEGVWGEEREGESKEGVLRLWIMDMDMVERYGFLMLLDD